MIPEDLVDFLESGVSVLVGTRDGELRPDAARAVGAIVHEGRGRVTLFISERTSQRAVANLAQNGEIAVGFSRPTDNLAIQLKGRCTEVRPATESERAIPERYHASYVDQLYMVGLPRSLTKRFHVWPCVAITFDVRDMFVQTPGPGAGKRLERAGAGA